MRITEVCHSWVVYRMTLPKQAVGGNVVCEQAEWDAIELGRPGRHTLIRSGIGSEGEAERLARGLQAPPEPPKSPKPPSPWW